MSNEEVQAATATESSKRKVNDIPSMLLQVTEKLLLVPGVSVAEIVNYSYPDCPENAPDWFLGYITWRKLEVPLVSFELLNGQAEPRAVSSQRIAVLNNTGVSEDIPFLAIVIQAIPRLIRITPKDIDVAKDVDLAPAEKQAISMGGDEAVYIPDISVLERACSQYLQAH
jgi:chemosensory pili system protein ChpC